MAIVPLRHDLQRNVRNQIKHDDCHFILSHVLKIGAGQVCFIEAKQFAVDSADGVAKNYQENGEQHEHADIDQAAPAEEGCQCCYGVHGVGP